MKRPLSLASRCRRLRVAGCGLGPGEELGGGVELRVTRDFGHERLVGERDEVPEGDSAMRLLQSERRRRDRLRRRVRAVDRGDTGAGPAGSRDWFYFVNGLEGDIGAAERGCLPATSSSGTTATGARR